MQLRGAGTRCHGSPGGRGLCLLPGLAVLLFAKICGATLHADVASFLTGRMVWAVRRVTFQTQLQSVEEQREMRAQHGC